MVRTVHADCAVVVDTNTYSVPWRLIGERVRVVVYGGRVRAVGTSGSLIVRIWLVSTAVCEARVRARGSFSNSSRRYQYGSRPFALAVSIKL